MPAPERPQNRLVVALRRRRAFLLAVVVPLIMLGIVLFGVVSDQYVVESRFAVINSTGSTGGNGSQSESKGGTALAEALAVRDYLNSLDGMETLRKTVNVVSMWRVPEADWITKLRNPDPPLEKLFSYYGWMVEVTLDQTSGLGVIRVQSYRPEDAMQINERLLQMAEQMVNRLSLRARDDALAVARNEVKIAEERVRAAQDAMVKFQQSEESVDPTATATIGQTSIGRLESSLTDTRAQLQEQLRYMRPDNPQVMMSRNRIAALEAQIAQERAAITQNQSQLREQGAYRGNQNLPAQLATFQRLQLEQTFASKQLDSATTSLEQARVDAARQQLFLARVVQPVLAEYPMEPRRLFILLSAGLVLIVLFGLSWLIVAGVREHGN